MTFMRACEVKECFHNAWLHSSERKKVTRWRFGDVQRSHWSTSVCGSLLMFRCSADRIVFFKTCTWIHWVWFLSSAVGRATGRAWLWRPAPPPHCRDHTHLCMDTQVTHTPNTHMYVLPLTPETTRISPCEASLKSVRSHWCVKCIQQHQDIISITRYLFICYQNITFFWHVHGGSVRCEAFSLLGFFLVTLLNLFLLNNHIIFKNLPSCFLSLLEATSHDITWGERRETIRLSVWHFVLGTNSLLLNRLSKLNLLMILLEY